MSRKKREVFLLRKAERQLYAAADWYANQNPQVADDWFDGIRAAVEALGTQAERFPLARENKAYPYDLRQMSFGLGKRITHRVLFVIRGDRVLVHQIRHVAQRDLTDDD